jgi:hypothetical protein
MFTQTDPKDNPQPGDNARNPDGTRIAPPVSGPGDRPFGVMGVDKPHGGGTMALEAMADDRAPPNVVDQRRPGPNPNNPQDPNNPFSTSRFDDTSLAHTAGVNLNPTGPTVTTEPMKTKNEERREAEAGKDASDGKKAKKKTASAASKRKRPASKSQSKTKAKSRSKAKSKAAA